jgi:AAHS family 4-hydroxybenzoate transporter-like MFS transporter
MNSQDRINVAEVVDNGRIGGFQIGLFLLCAACLILDGFDVQAVGYVNRNIRNEFMLDNTQFSWVSMSGLVGILVGALLFGGLGDRMGRRPVLIISTVCFSLLTLLTGFAASLPQLVVFRFLAGIGLGGIIPNAVALVGEYSPRRWRVFIVMLVQNGFNLGAAVGGFVALWLVPEYGWRSVFYVGGAVPLVIALVMIVKLPESLQFLALRATAGGADGGKHASAIRLWLTRLAPTMRLTPSTEYVAGERPRAGVPVGRLFEEGRAVGTSLLWVINFMNIMNIYFLGQWAPAVFFDAGFSERNAIWVGTTVQLGGTVGTLLLAWLISVHGYVRVLTVAFAVGAVALVLMGQSLSLTLLFAVTFVVGFCIVGSQGALNALAAAFYPTDLRSTGIGYCLGVGRTGGITGQPIVGLMRDSGWGGRQVFLAAAVPALIAASGVVALRRRIRAQGQNAAAPEPDVAAH